MAEGFPKLVVVAGPEEGTEFALPADEMCRLGRSGDNQIMLADSSVSRRHAAIAPRDGKYYLQDLESRNGTFWEDQKIKPDAEQGLSHLDEIDVGIYRLRFLEREPSAAELTARQQRAKTSSPVTDSPAVTTNKEEPEVEFLLDDIIREQQARSEIPPAEFSEIASENGLRLALFVFLFLMMLAAAGLYLTRPVKPLVEAPSQEIPVALMPKPKVADELLPPAEVDVQPVVTTPVLPITSTNPTVQNIFLDVKAMPMPATVFFQGERLGLTPMRKNVELKPDESQDLYLDFELKDINDIYRKKVNFSAKPGSDVVEINIQAEIGMLKIMKLPREAEFYLEGFYAYDSEHSRPVKISDIVYGRPIYLPYGRYVVELREQASVSGSANKISQVKFQREYILSADSPAIDLTVTDKDMREFPVVIKSNPTNADVIWNGQTLGQTPLQGTLPVGSNSVMIHKDGYFDKTLTVDMRFNSVYETLVTLETSKVGELVNEARVKIHADDKLEAINLLAEALKYGGTPLEKAEVYYLLGNTYFAQDQFDQAGPYFEKARLEPEFALQAALGLAKVRHAMGDAKQALALVVEVLVNIDDTTPPGVRGEANAIFKKISPIKSVIYIYTDPVGANVYLNDKKLNEVSPLILSDLGLGNYRIELEKPGHETYKTRQSLKLGEFALIKVKLKGVRP